MPESTDRAAFLRLLPASCTATLGRLEFAARGMMEGFFTGRHRSPNKGFSVEFAQHRQYVPGDDPRDLDWRVFARNDRYTIRQYIEETNLRATILLDASGSMGYRGECAAPVSGVSPSKFESARYVAAALVYLLVQQQDAAGLVTFDNRIRRSVPSASRTSQVRNLLDEMLATEPGGESALAPVLHEIAERIRRRGVVFIISDLFDSVPGLIKALHHFHHRNHEVIVFHVMAEEELTFPFNKFTHFKSLEVADRAMIVDPQTIKAKYLDRVETFVREVKRACGELNADYVPMSTAQPYDKVLADYLARRTRK